MVQQAGSKIFSLAVGGISHGLPTMWHMHGLLWCMDQISVYHLFAIWTMLWRHEEAQKKKLMNPYNLAPLPEDMLKIHIIFYSII